MSDREETTKVFISYSSKNEEFALALYKECLNFNLDVWFAPKSIQIGESYAPAIYKAIKDCNVFILILSTHSIKSEQVKREVGLAVKFEKKIFPIKIDDCQINEDFEYFLEGVQYIFANDKSLFSQHVKDFLKYLVTPHSKQNDEKKIIQDIQSKELFKCISEDINNIEQCLKEAILIDSQYYDDELRGQLDICLNWYDEDNSIYAFVVNEDDVVVGYINSMLVDKNTFNAILNGEFVDNNIPKESIIQALMPGIYRMYFCSIAIDNTYKKYKNIIFKLLYNSFFKKLLDFAKEGCYIEEIVADAVTYDGRNLAESFGLEEITTSNHNSRIYYSRLLPPKFKFYEGITKEVFELYKDYSDNYLPT